MLTSSAGPPSVLPRLIGAPPRWLAAAAALGGDSTPREQRQPPPRRRPCPSRTCLPRFIGIAGPSGSGKTTLARSLAAALGDGVLVVSVDAYYRDLSHLPAADREAVNFDAPAAIDDALLLRHMRRLCRGESVRVPLYQFASHTRRRGETVSILTDYLILEGLFALYWESVGALMDLRVYVDSPDDVCLGRRVARDVRERGRKAASVQHQYRRTVQPMRLTYIEPCRSRADLCLDGRGPIDDGVQRILEALLGN